MKPVRDASLPLPEPPDPAVIAAGAAHGRRAAGIHLAAPEPGDPPGTIARFTWPIPPRPRNPAPPWIARGTLGHNGSHLEVTTISLSPLPGTTTGPVTSALLRAISTTAITTAAQAHLALTALAEADLAQATRTTPRPAVRETAAAARPARQGRPPLPASILRAAAEAFLDEAPRGPGIHDRIASRLETIAGHPLTLGQVRNALARAEHDGWISPGRRGKGAQRSPGPRLTAAWQQERGA